MIYRVVCTLLRSLSDNLYTLGLTSGVWVCERGGGEGSITRAYFTWPYFHNDSVTREVLTWAAYQAKVDAG